MHSPAKKCAASRHVIIYSLQLTKSNKIKVTQIRKSLKGELISKANCQAMDSSKKRTNEFFLLL